MVARPVHVSLKEKCKLSWDRVFRACKSLDAARGQQLPRGRAGVAAILSLGRGQRRREGRKNTSQQPRVVVVMAVVVAAILAQGQPNLI